MPLFQLEVYPYDSQGQVFLPSVYLLLIHSEYVPNVVNIMLTPFPRILPNELDL